MNYRQWIVFYLNKTFYALAGTRLLVKADLGQLSPMYTSALTVIIVCGTRLCQNVIDR